jgi:hypothetical protein
VCVQTCVTEEREVAREPLARQIMGCHLEGRRSRGRGQGVFGHALDGLGAVGPADVNGERLAAFARRGDAGGCPFAPLGQGARESVLRTFPASA